MPIPALRRRILLAFVLLALLAAAARAGWAYYRQEVARARETAGATIEAVADLKAHHIGMYLAALRHDAGVVGERLQVRGREAAGRNGASGLTRDELESAVSGMIDAERFSRAVLRDPSGAVIAVVPVTETAGQSSGVPRRGDEESPRFVDMYMEGERVLFGYEVPLPAGTDMLPAVSLSLDVDASRFLFPFVQSWPVPSATAETLLVRREGDQVLFMNDLRHKPGRAMRLGLPLDSPDVPAVRAVPGDRATRERKDYRGVPVLATARTIADTRWVLISKVDIDEVDAPLRQDLGRTALSLLLFGACAVLVTLLARRGAAARRERARIEEAEQAAELGRLYAVLAGIAGVARQQPDLDSLFAEACRVIVAEGGFALAWVGVAKEGRVIVPVAAAGAGAAYLEGVEVPIDRDSPAAVAFREDEVYLCRSQSPDQGMSPWMERASRFGLRSCLTVPLRREGRPFGTLEILDSRPFAFDQRRRDLLERIGAVLSNAVDGLDQKARRERAEESARHNQSLLRLFIEHAPAAIAMFDREMRYIAASRRWMADHSIQGEVTGRSHHDLLSETGDRWKEVHRRVLAGETIRSDEERFDRADGSTQWLRWEARPWLGPGGEVGGVIVFSEDVTRYKAAIQALAAAKERLTLAIRASNIGLWDWDLTTDVVHYSTEWKAQIGYREDEIQDRLEEWRERVHPDDLGPILATMRDFLEGRIPKYEAEFRLRHRDGSWRWMYTQADVVRDENGRPIRMLGCHIDVTDRKEAEERLRALVASLASIREDERTRLSRELHDSVGQSLTAVRIGLTRVSRRLEDPPEKQDGRALRERLAAAVRDVDATLAAVRKIASDLRPGVLDDLGLAAAVEWLVNDFQARTGLDCLATVPERVDVEREASTALFRAAQELLTNVIRHAGASRVRVSLFEEGQEVVLQVEDDGRGVRPEDLTRQDSLGLVGVRERLGAVSGRFVVRDGPERGTIAEARVPRTWTAGRGLKA